MYIRGRVESSRVHLVSGMVWGRLGGRFALLWLGEQRRIYTGFRAFLCTHVSKYIIHKLVCLISVIDSRLSGRWNRVRY